MRTLGFLLRKEFRQIFRNRSILAMIVLMPIIQLLIMPLAADYEIKQVNLAVVDHDRSVISRELISSIYGSGYFISSGNYGSYEEANRAFADGSADLILELPEHMESDLRGGKSVKALLAANAINGVKGPVGTAYLNRIIKEFNLQWQKGRLMQPLEVNSLNWFNPFLNYQTFMVPGILVLLVTMIGVYMSALNIVKEKEVGTIEQVNVSPIRKHHFILGKLIPFWLIGLFVFSLGLLGVARLVYDIVPVGSLLALYLFLMLYLIAILGIGLLLSTYARTQQQAMSLAFFVMMIFILMGGLFTPIESMPQWAQNIAAFNPVKYFIDVVRLVVLKGSGFMEIAKYFGIMALMAIAFNTWAVLNYRKTS